jgi:hypothetical protein
MDSRLRFNASVIVTSSSSGRGWMREQVHVEDGQRRMVADRQRLMKLNGAAGPTSGQGEG